MKYYFIFATIIFFSIGLGCDHAHHNDKSSHEGTSLQLNNVQKWIANTETHEGMNNLQDLTLTISDTTDYTSLAYQMQNETQYIIENCNMTGEDHDQLHMVLHPILNSISEIKGADDPELQKAEIVKIQENLKDYFDHFKSN